MKAPFVHPPCMPGRWLSLEDELGLMMRQRLVEQPFPELRNAVIGKMRALELPFWRDHFLVESAIFDCRIRGLPVGTHVSIYGRSGYTPLSGDAPPIHFISNQFGLLLENEDLAEAYLRFFCAAISGENGRFQIVDSLDDLAHPEAIRPELKPLLSGLRWEGSDPDGAWLFEGIVHYDKILFEAWFRVPRDGMVSMDADEELTEASLAWPWPAPGSFRNAGVLPKGRRTSVRRYSADPEPGIAKGDTTAPVESPIRCQDNSFASGKLSPRKLGIQIQQWELNGAVQKVVLPAGSHAPDSYLASKLGAFFDMETAE